MTHPTPSDGLTGASGQAVLRRRALWWATVLCDCPDTPWTLGEQNDHEATTVLRETTADLLQDQPTTLAGADVVLAAGAGGLVVLLHQRHRSIAARAGGPLVVVDSDHPDGLIVQAETPLGSQLDGSRIGGNQLDGNQLDGSQVDGGQNVADLIETLIVRARGHHRGRDISHRF